MKRRDSTGSRTGPDEAARRFVRIDAGEAGADAELTTWLAERDENERALERVELAVALGRRLAADPDNALHAEATRAAGTVPRRRTAWRELAWGGALAAMLLVVIVVVPDAVSPSREPEPVALQPRSSSPSAHRAIPSPSYGPASSSTRAPWPCCHS